MADKQDAVERVLLCQKVIDAGFQQFCLHRILQRDSIGNGVVQFFQTGAIVALPLLCLFMLDPFTGKVMYDTADKALEVLRTLRRDGVPYAEIGIVRTFLGFLRLAENVIRQIQAQLAVFSDSTSIAVSERSKNSSMIFSFSINSPPFGCVSLWTNYGLTTVCYMIRAKK